MARTWAESTGMYLALAWYWSGDNVRVHAQSRDVPYLFGGNDLEGMDCSGLFTYMMNTMGFTYEDRNAQCLFDELFIWKPLRPPLTAALKAYFYGYSKSEIVHVAFPITSVSSAWVVHATNAYQGIDGFSGLRLDRFSDLKNAWSSGKWYTRFAEGRMIFKYQSVASSCT